MLRCTDCGFERPMMNSLLGAPHGPNCRGSWLEVPDRVYSGGNTSTANPMRVAEAEMQKFLAHEFNQINQINQANQAYCQQQAALNQGLGQLGPRQVQNVVIESYRQQAPDYSLGANLVDENAKLREENEQLRQQALEAHGGAMATLDDWTSKDVENKRLKMEVADLKGQLVDHEAKAELQAAEFRFCSQEIRRTNPRLAKARWGK